MGCTQSRDKQAPPPFGESVAGEDAAYLQIASKPRRSSQEEVELTLAVVSSQLLETQRTKDARLEQVLQALSASQTQVATALARMSRTVGDAPDAFDAAHYNAPGSVYGYPLYVYSPSGVPTFLNPWSATFWCLMDTVFVTVQFRMINMVDVSYQGSTDPARFSLPFKMINSTVATTPAALGSPTIGQRGCQHAAGKIWGYKDIASVQVTNYVNSDKYFRILGTPGYTSADNTNFITCGDLYNRTLDMQATFVYKAAWPLVPTEPNPSF